MREIKFRAWASSQKRMHYDVGILNGLVYLPIGENLTTTNSLMQFTGLKDKNGKEIYEGDLIGYWHGAFWAVGWSEREGKYMFQYPGGKDDVIPSTGESLAGTDGFAVTKSVCSTKKIIGNIYENSELLTNN